MPTQIKPGDTGTVKDDGFYGFYAGTVCKVVEFNQPYSVLVEMFNGKRFWMHARSAGLAK